MLKAICLGINRRGVSNSREPAAKLLLPELPRARYSPLLLSYCCYTIHHPASTRRATTKCYRAPLPSNRAPIPAIAATAAATALANSCHCQGAPHCATVFATANAKTTATAWTNPSNGCC